MLLDGGRTQRFSCRSGVDEVNLQVNLRQPNAQDKAPRAGREAGGDRAGDDERNQGVGSRQAQQQDHHAKADERDNI